MEEQALLSPSYPNSCSGHLQSSLLSRRRQRKLKDATILYNRLGPSTGGVRAPARPWPVEVPEVSRRSACRPTRALLPAEPRTPNTRLRACWGCGSHPVPRHRASRPGPGLGGWGVLQGTRVISSIRDVLFQGN